MLIWMFTIISTLHAQSAPTFVSCEVQMNGEIQFVSGISGCTEKKRSANGSVVTYQQTVPQFDPATSKISSVQKTYTITVDKKDDNLVTTSMFEGEDPKKAALITTHTVNTTANDPHNNLLETVVKQKHDGKEDRYLVYDRNLCARFREAGKMDSDIKAMQACASVLPKYEDAAIEWSKKLQSTNTSLGIPSLSMNGVQYRPAKTGSLNDLITIVGACSLPVENVGPNLPSPPPAPKKAPINVENLPDSRTKQ